MAKLKRRVRRSNDAHERRIKILKHRVGRLDTKTIGYHYKVINRQSNENRVLPKKERRKLYY